MHCSTRRGCRSLVDVRLHHVEETTELRCPVPQHDIVNAGGMRPELHVPCEARHWQVV
jgi:hypothetical protein